MANPGSTSLWQQTIISPSHSFSSFLFRDLDCRPLATKLLPALKKRFPNEALPRIVFTDRGKGFYNTTGGITPEWSAGLAAAGLRPFQGDDAAEQAPAIGDVGQNRMYSREKPWLRCNLRGRDGCGVEEGRVWESGGVRCFRTRTFCFPIECNPRCAPPSYFRRLDDMARTTSLRISSAPRSFGVE